MSSESPVSTLIDNDALIPEKLGDMSIDQLSKSLDGKVGLGMGRWGGIIALFLLAVTMAIVAFVVVWIVFSKQLAQESGAREHDIVTLTGATSSQQITKTTDFIYAVNATNALVSTILTVSRPDASIQGAPANFVTNLNYATNSTGDTSSAALNVISTTETDKNVVFKFLNGASGATFKVFVAGIPIPVGVDTPILTVVAGSYTASRKFVWTDEKTLTEINATDGFMPAVSTPTL